MNEIRDHIEQFPPAADGRIFYTNGHSGLLGYESINAALRSAAKKIGMTPPSAHQLRHFCASLLIQNRASVKQVQEFLGHENEPVTLDTYTDLWPDNLDELAIITDRAASVRAAVRHGPLTVRHRDALGGDSRTPGLWAPEHGTRRERDRLSEWRDTKMLLTWVPTLPTAAATCTRVDWTPPLGPRRVRADHAA